MDKTLNEIKVAVAAILASCTALFGWFGWLCIVLLACMVLDYVTGTAVAKKTGTWSSKVARDGRWHKVSIVVAVTAGLILDLVLGIVLNNIPMLELPFEYTVAFAPVIVVWYILTELGSILENSGELGGPQPAWFKRAIAALKDQVDSVAEEKNGRDAHGNESTHYTGKTE